MRRALALAVLLILAPSLADAQIMRFRKKTPPPAAAAPVVIITGPTASDAMTTPSSSINLAGTATAAPTLGIKSVTASVNGGAAIPAVVDGLGNWSITASGAEATIAADTFNPPGSNVCIPTRVSTPSGGTWTEVTDTGNDDCFQLLNGTGTVRISASDTNDRLIATLAPSTALSGTDYTVKVKVASVIAGSGIAQGLVFGAEAGATPNDYCAVVIYEASASPDLYLVKVVGGTITDLGSANADIGAGDTVLADVDGSTLLVKKNGSQVISATSADCDTGTNAGIFSGNVRSAGDDGNSNFSMDDFEMVDRGAVQAGVPLSVGANTIVVTVTDTTDVTSTDVLNATRSASDTTPPTIQFQLPTSGATYNAPATTVTMSGIAEDIGGSVSSVSMSCTNATPGSPMVTGTTSWSAAQITLTGGVAVCTATATDAGTNTAQAILSITPPDAGDVTPPVMTITTNGGAGAGVNFSTSASTQSLGGTCVDSVGCSVVTFTCPLCPIGGTVSGVGSWNIANIPLNPNVAHVITVRGCDLAGNCHEDTITVTRTVADLVIGTTTLPNGTNGSVYGGSAAGVCLSATGGVTPYTWSISVGSLPGWATLNASTGCITGTPNAEATTNFTALVTDSQGSPDTDPQALSITVVAAGAETAHSFYTTNIARGDCWITFSLRPVASGSSTIPTNCSNPHFRNQIAVTGSDNNTLYNGPVGAGDFTYGWKYDPATDTDPNKQDAAAYTFPSFMLNNQGQWGVTNSTLTNSINDSETTITVTGGLACCVTVDYTFAIDNEIFKTVSKVGQVVTVQRGQFGTTAAAHTAGTVIKHTSNSFGYAQLKIDFPGPTEDGNDYVFTWDEFQTSSFFIIDSAWAARKSYILNYKGGNGSGGFLLEPRHFWSAGAVDDIPNTCSDATHVSVMATHSYLNDNGPAIWAESNGQSIGPGWLSDELAYVAFPAVAEMGTVNPSAHCVPANKWVRYVLKWRQIANDYDRFSQWACTEGEGSCTAMYLNVPVSAHSPTSPSPGTDALYSLWFRYNTSTDRHGRGSVTSTACDTVAEACGPFTPLRGYARNFSAHKATIASGTFTTIDSSNFLVAPIR
jgi:hypothetical protein